jgi:uncharacterized protein YjbJ (UPF0337 family)
MGYEDVTAGKIKQIKGRANAAIGATKGDTTRELKGKVQRFVGKAQEAYGRATSKRRGK